MLIGIIGTPREEILKNVEAWKEAPLRFSESLKQLPAGVTVKGRYLFGGGDNMKSIVIFDAQSPEQLYPLMLSITEYVHSELYPVVDNTGEVLQEVVREL